MKLFPLIILCIFMFSTCSAVTERTSDTVYISAQENDRAEEPGNLPDQKPGKRVSEEQDSEAMALAFWYAALENRPDIIIRGLTQGTDAFWYEIKKTLTLFMRLKPEEGIETDLKNDAISIAMWLASQAGHTDIVRLLLERGARVNAMEATDGRTALWQASQGGHMETVKLLLENGAKIETRSLRTGATPLFIAAARGHEEVVTLLLNAGANANVKASAGEKEDTPLSIAKERNHTGIVELFERAMAEK